MAVAQIAAEGSALIARHVPDSVLIDIDGVVADGLTLAARHSAFERGGPFVVLLSAAPDHAVRAFESSAIDYLLKPLTAGRLSASVRRAAALARLRAVAQPPAIGPVPGSRDEERIWALRGARLVPLRMGDIELVEAERDYVRLHTDERNYLLRTTLGALHEAWDGTAIFASVSQPSSAPTGLSRYSIGDMARSMSGCAPGRSFGSAGPTSSRSVNG